MTMGPILYGYVITAFPNYENIDGKEVNVSRAGMYMIYWSSAIGLVTLGIALLFQKKN
jgi:hypothetical protein